MVVIIWIAVINYKHLVHYFSSVLNTTYVGVLLAQLLFWPLINALFIRYTHSIYMCIGARSKAMLRPFSPYNTITLLFHYRTCLQIFWKICQRLMKRNWIQIVSPLLSGHMRSANKLWSFITIILKRVSFSVFNKVLLNYVAEAIVKLFC